MVPQAAASMFSFAANNAAMNARDIAKGNIVIYGNGNIVNPSSSRSGSPDDHITIEKALNWLGLYSVNYFSVHEKARQQKALGTGGWFFGMNEYKAWVAIEGKGPRSLQCVGIPGAGKTTLASSVIHTLDDTLVSPGDDTSIVLYAYFRHDTQDKQTVPHVLASLLHQAIKHKNKLSHGMRRLYSDYSSNGKVAPALDRLTEVLQFELSSFKAVYIVIDALDEFCLKDYSMSYPLVVQLQHLNAKLMITSRLPVSFIPNTYFTLEISAHADDIRLFAREQMAGRLAGISNAPGLLEEIVKVVIKKSQGMFVYARLLLNCIPNDALTENEIRAALKKLPSAGNLNDIYKLIMQRILAQTPRLAQLALLTLCWVYFSKRRLTIKELRHAVSFKPGTKTICQGDLIPAERILSACAGLVTSVRSKLDDNTGVDLKNDESVDGVHRDIEGESECQFSHFTAKEFFDQVWADYFPNGETKITETCLDYLTVVVPAIPSEITQRVINASSFENDDDEEWQQYRTSRFALCGYAATFWGGHAYAIDEELDLDASASFFEHAISPYIAEPLNIFPTIGMLPVLYWILYSSRHGLLKYLQWFSSSLTALQSHNDVQAASLDYNGIRDRYAWTALHFAARYGHVKIVNYLLDNGADPNANGDISIAGPLHLAVVSGNPGLATVQLLLNHSSALVDQPDHWHTAKAPISYATTSNQPSPDIVRLLLQYEVDIYREDNRAKTPLSRAQESEHPEIRHLIEEYSRTHPPKRRAYAQIFPGGHHSASDSESEHTPELESEPPQPEAAPSISSEREPSLTGSKRANALGSRVDESPTQLVPEIPSQSDPSSSHTDIRSAATLVGLEPPTPMVQITPTEVHGPRAQTGFKKILKGIKGLSRRRGPK